MAGLGRRSHYRKHLTNSILNDFPEPTPPNERIAKVVGTRGSNQFEVVLAPDQQQQGGENAGSTIVSRNSNWDRTPQLALLPSKFRKLVWVKRNDYVICSCAAEDEEEESDGDSENDVSGEEPTKPTLGPRGTTTSKTMPPSSSSIPGGIRYMITHILYKDQVKHLKDVHKWPIDPFFDNDALARDEVDGSGKKKEEMDGIILRAKALAIANEQEDRRRRNMDGGADEENKGEMDHAEHLKIGQSDSQSGHNNEYDDEYVYDDDLFINTNRIAKMTIDDSSSDESD